MMETFTATEVKNRFGEYIEKARREPISVEKNGRKYVVIISDEEYERLKALEDSYWIARAREAEESGYVGTDATLEALAVLRSTNE